MRLTILFLFLLTGPPAAAQGPDLVQPSALRTAPLVGVAGLRSSDAVPWAVSVKPAFEKKHGPDLSEIKAAKAALKRSAGSIGAAPLNDARTTASAPAVGANFAANGSLVGTPADNSVAISNSGQVVSVNNDGVFFSAASGSGSSYTYWTDFFTGLPSSAYIYDPRVIYDPVADRFIIVILNGYTSAESDVIVLFSKTSTPATGGWNQYAIPGNILGNGTWLDYPNIGISGQDLFITGNLFTDGGSFDQSIIYQVGKAAGYADASLNYAYFSGLSTSPYGAFSIVPATHAFGSSTDAGIYLLSNNTGGASSVRLWHINANLTSSPTLSSTTVTVPFYSPPADAFQPSGGDQLSTGGCRVQEAFLLDGFLHAVFNTDVGSGYSGVYYLRLNVNNNTAQAATYGEADAGVDVAYPCLASASRLLQNPPSKSVIIGFCRASSGSFPSIGAVNCDNAMAFSAPVTVQTGTSIVDYSAGSGTERWGDYTHAQRRFNSNPARVWIGASYGTNISAGGSTFTEKYRTRIAELISTDTVGSAAGLEEGASAASRSEAAVYPNPLAGPALLRIGFTNPAQGVVVIQLHDATGRTVRTLHRGHLRAGSHLLAFNEGALSGGTYTITIAAGDQMLHREKLVVVR